MEHQYGNKEEIPYTDRIRSNLRAHCEKCFGLCCIALYFSASDGFPADKDAGQPCLNLQTDFRCGVYKNLKKHGLKGCNAYDCLGAGQRVSQVTFGGHDWRQVPGSAKQMFEAFLIMWQLHEMLWYLTEALTLQPTIPIHEGLISIAEKTERLTNLSPDALMKLDIAAHRADVSALLLQSSELVRAEARRGQNTCTGSKTAFRQGDDLIAADLRKANLRGANLKGAYLIAADLRGVDLSGTDLLGVDLRDADLRGANLSCSIFLTQAQVNVAKGDASTKLPPALIQPAHWLTLEA